MRESTLTTAHSPALLAILATQNPSEERSARPASMCEPMSCYFLQVNECLVLGLVEGTCRTGGALAWGAFGRLHVKKQHTHPPPDTRVLNPGRILRTA